MSLTLLDWRRRTAAAFAAYRAAPDPAQGWATWRAQRAALLRDHPDSPLPAGRREQPPFLPYDPALRHELPLLPAAPEQREVPTGTDGTVGFSRIGRLEVPAVGSLDVWWLQQYGGGLFVPLRDATCGHGAYGGGRYLLDTVKGADHGGDVDPVSGRGVLVLDLNLAYHPSCAYDPAWACPLAPPGNTVPAAVRRRRAAAARRLVLTRRRAS